METKHKWNKKKNEKKKINEKKNKWKKNGNETKQKIK